ncbi:MAG: dienelactone hydrolase family protein [Ectothiorhodospiraceae bacterium]|nr:dienelactone hydrolase family protein [Ectothiorhodospiraceae bacterium]
MSADSASIKTETVTYDAKGTQCKGYLALAGGTGPRPGVLVVHEWWGLDDYIRGRARMLAELGYNALAVDMYGGGQTASDPQGAGALMNGVLGDVAAAEARLAAARATLAAQAGTDASRIAAIGYCFGGAMVLHAARIGMDLRAVASFHGALGSFHKPAPGSVKAKILVCHGGADALIPEADIANFKQEMDAAGADYEFVSYDGALHGFSNPNATANGEKYGLPLRYDADVDKRSWAAMKALFERAL